ncbi:MAG: 2-phospho-L-lactate guanylyltransferase [Acidimicrobiales bacterium]
MPRHAPIGPAAVLIPVKSFVRAKRRLSPTLHPDERAQLARRMATRVLAAAQPLPVTVACDDDEVADWARAAGAEVLWRPGRGLNGAVADGVEHLGRGGAQRVVVAHADLPLATGLAAVAAFDGVTLVPDRRDDGTNVLCVPPGAGFRFAYGPRSFARHRNESERLGLPYRVLRDLRLEWDVDVPDDLLWPRDLETTCG